MAKKEPEKGKSPDANGNEDLLTSFGAGEFVFREGDDGSVTFIVESGKVEILRRFGGNERRVALLGPGDFFGEMAVLEEMPRSASARCVEDARLLEIDAPTFDRILKKHPEIGLRIMRSLSGRLREYALQEKRAREIAAGALRGVERKEGVMTPVSMPRDADAGAPEAAPGGEGDAVMLVLVHEASKSTVPLPAGDEITVGRPDPSSGWRPDLDLGSFDTERSLSRRHAVLRRREGRLFLEEPKRTANGTWHGSRRLEPGVECELEAGDRFRLGLVDFHVERLEV